MEIQKNTLIIIPARGGSKGIPRKNLRNLNDKPLIAYSIEKSLKSKFKPDVYVSSEDEEILSISKQFGAKTIKRESLLSEDDITLDQVIAGNYRKIEAIEKKQYDYIITIQPTSPLLAVESVDQALERIMNQPEIDTIISAKEDTHLSWRMENGRYLPNYIERLNRQYLPKEYRETGGFLICKAENLQNGKRIGNQVELYLLNQGETIDIDNYEDWQICEYYLKRKRILFVVSGYAQIGLGHVYRSLIIANNILNHEITFLVDKKSQLAYQKIAEHNYSVLIQQNENILTDIEKLHPDVIINDILDTNSEYIKQLKRFCHKIINFEDLGEGAHLVDLVINALYPEDRILKNHYFGHKYFIARDEFLFASPKEIKEKVSSVLITFGGTDPNNYTLKVIHSIQDFCLENNIKITVICGLGYTFFDTLDNHPNIKVLKNVANISEYMRNADLVFSSAGRTVYEIACIGTPAIIMAQNNRELTHFFGSIENGFQNLGLGYELTDNDILETFKKLEASYETRKYMSQLMLSKKVRNGKKKVIALIKKQLELI